MWPKIRTIVLTELILFVGIFGVLGLNWWLGEDFIPSAIIFETVCFLLLFIMDVNRGYCSFLLFPIAALVSVPVALVCTATISVWHLLLPSSVMYLGYLITDRFDSFFPIKAYTIFGLLGVQLIIFLLPLLSILSI